MPVWITKEETLKLTEAAIDSIGEVFMIIVDNASVMGTDYLQEMSDHYIRNDSNLGFAKAVNQGIKYLEENHPEITMIAVANNDILVSPNWQEVTKDILQDNKIFSLHFRMDNYDNLFDYGEKLAKSGMERWCTASFFVINTGANGYLYFDERFFNSYDDWDFFFRAREKGHFTSYTDRACYLHKFSHTQQLIPERAENDKKNSEQYKEKHGVYAEDQFIKMYPDQQKIGYWEGFRIKR